jgi:tRNA(fMet)-specific endonuclease VapC
MIVLDTDIATLLSYGKTAKLNARIAGLDNGEKLALTIITRMEMLAGRFASIKNAADHKELRMGMERFFQTERFLLSFSRLNVDNAALTHFESLLKGKKTKKMRRNDMLIACIALAHKTLLVTRNVSDYKDVPGLRVENWAD